MLHNRWFTLGGPTVALLALLFVAGDALAQRGGGRGGGGGREGGRGGSSWGGRGWDGGRGGRSEWRGDGWGRGGDNRWYDRRGWYDPWGYDGYMYGGYPEDYNSFYYGSSGSTYTDRGAGAETPMDENAALIAVRVPPEAEIWFDGKKTSQAGPVRRFETPPLEPGNDYSYEVRARWNENGREVDRTRKVMVHAGDRLALNFVHRQNRETPTATSSRTSSTD
jgi:uncharacterized protein (TIGR03000 family)